MKMIKNFYLMLSLPLFLGMVAVNNVEAALFRPRNLGASRIYAGRTSAAMAGIPRQTNERMVGAGSQLPNRQPSRSFFSFLRTSPEERAREEEKARDKEIHFQKIAVANLESLIRRSQTGFWDISIQGDIEAIIKGLIKDVKQPRLTIPEIEKLVNDAEEVITSVVHHKFEVYRFKMTSFENSPESFQEKKEQELK